MKTKCFSCLIFFWMMMTCTLAPEVYAIEVKLTVTENAGLSRLAEPVSSGIPFKMDDGVYSTANFGVFNGAVEVPAQFTVLSRWHGSPDDPSKPIRWVLVEFQSDCAAAASNSYLLKTTGGSGTASGGMVITETTGSLVVNTAEAEFTVNKKAFNLFDRVLIRNPADGNRVTKEVVSAGGLGPYLTRADNDRDYLAKNNTLAAQVERRGPLHTIVLLTGKHREVTGSDTLSWKARLHFYQGKSYVKVDYTVTDVDTLPLITQYVGVKKIVLPLRLNKDGEATYTLAGDAPGTKLFTGSLADPSGAWLVQSASIDQGSVATTGASSETADDGTANTITYSLGGQATGSGARSRGWADVSDSEKGITAAVKYFWQMYPKKLEVDSAGNLYISLWPAEAPTLKFFCAAQKTHEILYYFHNGNATAAGSDALVDSLFGVTTSWTTGAASSSHHNLVPIAPAEYYASTKAIGYVGVRNVSGYPAENQALVTKYYGYVYGLLDRSLRERFSGGTRGGGHEYMMWSFGDSRDATWSNMAYDALRADALLFAATADRKFLDHLEEVTLHFRDVDVEHNVVSTNRGAASSLAAKYLGRTRYNPSDGGQHDLGYAGRTAFGFEHYKGQGLADHYFLTGDPLSKDILAEAYHYYGTWKALQDYADDSGVRAASKPLGIIIGHYQVTGLPTAKSDADYVIRYLNTWQRRTTANDPGGLMWMGSNDTTSSAQAGLTLNFMMEYMKDLPDPIDVTKNIVDACNYLVDPVNKLWTGRYFNDWPNNNYGIANATVIDFMAIGGLSFCSRVTSDSKYKLIGITALSNGIDKDTSNGNLKPYGQKTRYVPGFLYFLRDSRPDPILIRKK